MTLFSTLIAALLIAAAPKPAEPVFTRVSVEPEGLCFDSPVDLDWESGLPVAASSAYGCDI